MNDVLEYVLTEPIAEAAPADVDQAWARHLAVAEAFRSPVDRAVAGGFAADRLGVAFLSGYQEALRKLLPEVAGADLLAVSATEEGGAHPSSIRTALVPAGDGWVVRGTKTFTTMGERARQLVVIAGTGEVVDGRPRLRAVLVAAEQPGVTVTNRPPLPMAPEIPHATVVFADAPARLLPGDGYLNFLKPFRTIEDAHVLAATLGWLVRVGRAARWPRATLQRLLASVAMVRGLDLDSPASPGVHIALGGIFAEFERLLTESEPLWQQVDAGTRERWERDRPLLATAGRVRAQRLETAWRRVAID
ncbi:acyl-CoA dehydrogenase family protein [Nocardia goodfellowii]|uniref:Alkylation response protein AidB-like acyl-CoA dehydrogenase n=1 Tax=Nocardia goodfellowii TaxID=882446 RepID=A0ABS4Q947_9NOCA|nr:acyl-CoA dehydrogenase family protein [Nocardia goodfellowii]MBP2188211.1 alkylation response protein AidB-like acyl-CoA dehydrogenase [Nocardia goodfellowii]